MSIKNQTIEERVIEATEDYKNALLEQISASIAETDAQKRKRKAHSAVQSAGERLNDLRKELMEGIIIKSPTDEK